MTSHFARLLIETTFNKVYDGNMNFFVIFMIDLFYL